MPFHSVESSVSKQVKILTIIGDHPTLLIHFMLMFSYQSIETYTLQFSGSLSNHLIYLLRGLCSHRLTFATSPKYKNPWRLSRDKKTLRVADPGYEAGVWIRDICKMLEHFDVYLTGSFICELGDDDFWLCRVDESGVNTLMTDLPSPYDSDDDDDAFY